MQVGEQGVVELEGSDGRRWKEHMRQLAPCHLPNLDHAIRPTTWIPHADTPCHLCGRPDRSEVMLLCERCNRGFHLDCLNPRLDAVPEGDWFYAECLELLPGQ